MINEWLGSLGQYGFDPDPAKNPDERTSLANALNQFIDLLFAQIGERGVRDLYGDRMGFVSEKSVSEMLSEVLKAFGESSDATRAQAAVRDFFLGGGRARDEYIEARLRSHFLARILCVDEDANRLVAEQLATKTLYLDENVVFALLGLQENVVGSRRAAETVVAFSKDLGMGILVSSETMVSFEDKVHQAQRRYSEIGRTSEVVAAGLLKEGLDDRIIEAYWELQTAGRKREWEAFVSEAGAARAILRSKYGVEVDTTPRDALKTDPRLSDLISQVYKAEHEYKPKSGRGAEHDAFHFLLIDALRANEQPTVLGSDYWFITLDRTLYWFDKFARHGRSGIPFAATCAEWIAILCSIAPPRLRPDTRGSAAKALVAAALIEVKPAVSVDFIAQIVSPLYDTSLPPEVILLIASDRHARSEFRALRESGRVSHGKANQILVQAIRRIESKLGDNTSMRVALAEAQEQLAQKDAQLAEHKTRFRTALAEERARNLRQVAPAGIQADLPTPAPSGGQVRHLKVVMGFLIFVIYALFTVIVLPRLGWIWLAASGGVAYGILVWLSVRSKLDTAAAIAYYIAGAVFYLLGILHALGIVSFTK